MRIITGSARGVNLKSPKGMNTRPTSDRVKEALFSILGQKVANRHVLDIFAGTGGLGLEALSRGSAEATFIDKATFDIIEYNAKATKLAERCRIMKGDVFASLAKLKSGEKEYGLVFIDPPYQKGLWEKTLVAIDDLTLLSLNAIVVVEHGGGENNYPMLKNLELVDNRRYGHTTQLSFFQRRDFLAAD